MGKPINRIMDALKRRANVYRQDGSVIALVIGCTSFAMILVGCSVSTEKKGAPQPVAETPTAKTTTPSTASSNQKLAAQALSLEELSVREERGQTTLLVRFSQPITQFRHFPLPQPARIILDIFSDAKALPQSETFRIDTNWVAALRLSFTDGSLRLVMDIAAGTVPVYTIHPEDGGLRIVVGSLDASATAKKDVTLVRAGQRIDIRGTEVAPTASSASKLAGYGADDPLNTEKKYTGQKISLDFKDADIKNVFRLLAEVSGKNFVVTDEVNRRVTLHLSEVPWDQALDILVDTNSLKKVETGNVIRISTTARFKSDQDALAAEKISAENSEPLQTVYFNVNYAKARELEPKVKALLSKRVDAALVTDERSNTIMVRDIRKVVDDVSTLVGKLDARTPQVLIESNLIETSPTFARALGMRLQFTRAGTTIRSDFTPGSGTPAAGIDPVISIIQDKLGGLRNLTAELTAAEQEGNVKIISRPSVVTLNNVASTIQSLRILRIALPSSTNIASGSGAAAGTAVATEKINTGITLSVTPQVSSDGFILMNINVKSSSVAPTASPSSGAAASGVIPFDELSREANANVLVRDGETIVVGGIMQDNTSTGEAGIPWIKDIPVLGWLFKNATWRKEFAELMVFITPRISSAGSENMPTAEQLWRENMKMTEGEQPPPLPLKP